jgi:cytochrome c peroxidase
LRRHPRSILVSSLFVAFALLAPGRVSGEYLDDTGFLPLAPTPQPPNVVALSPAEQLGKDIFFDATLSNPPGYACATCHVPSTGFTGPDSFINQAIGTSPGVIFGRFGKRKAQAVTYSGYSPRGPIYDSDLQVWLGGNFWDGRATGLPEQARMPFLDPNEMNNTPVGPYPPHAGGYSPLVAQKIRTAPYAALFEQVCGLGSLASPDALVYAYACNAITMYEASREVNKFSSKFDASKFAVPPQNGYKLSASELNGMNLFFGNAQCSQCHSSATLGIVQAFTAGKDVFTMFCYANIGVPKNPDNPIYNQTEVLFDPFGANPSGFNFIDFGLGMNPNPSLNGTYFMSQVPGDIPQFRGLFKAPSVRNVDKRPSTSFVKAYMHNGVFKSLEEVVHWYNTRNIAVNKYGHQISFDLTVGPPAGYTRLQPPPEVIDNVQNVRGNSPASAGPDVFNNGQVGNLGLSSGEEADLVNFLKILTDQ